MNDQTKEEFFKMIEQETEKANVIKAKYCSIDETILFLHDQNIIRYSQADLKELVYSGVLTPYFYYQGVLIRVDRLGENLMDAYCGLVKFEGYITPFNQATLKATQYASSEVTVSCKDVLIAKDNITLEIYADSVFGEYGEPVWDSISENYLDVSYYIIADEINKENLLKHPNLNFDNSLQFSSRLEDWVFHKDDLAKIKKIDQEKSDHAQRIESHKDSQIAELRKENENLKQLVDDLRKSQSSMVCCDPEHEYYAPELHDVIKLWSYLYLDGGLKAGHSHTEVVGKWFKNNFLNKWPELQFKRYKTITAPKTLKQIDK